MQAWAALSPKERSDKEAFYRGQQGTARGFMQLAITTLRLLNTLTSDDTIVSAPLACRAPDGLVLAWCCKFGVLHSKCHTKCSPKRYFNKKFKQCKMVLSESLGT